VSRPVTRVRWERAPYGGALSAAVGRVELDVRPEPGGYQWRADVWRGRGCWTTWRRSERGAKAAAVALARKLGG
jgi:hypothetical protein